MEDLTFLVAEILDCGQTTLMDFLAFFFYGSVGHRFKNEKVNKVKENM